MDLDPVELLRRVRALPGDDQASARGMGHLVSRHDVLDEIFRWSNGEHAREPWVLHEGCDCARCRWLRPSGKKTRGPIGVIR